MATTADELDPEVADDELLERFLPKNQVRRDGTLKWQAVKLTEKDQGALSVGRLLVGVEALQEAGNAVITAGVVGFAETKTLTMRSLSHEVVATEGDFVGHAEIRPAGLRPEWPAPYDPADTTPEWLAMVDYYEALVKQFRFRPLVEGGAPSVG